MSIDMLKDALIGAQYVSTCTLNTIKKRIEIDTAYINMLRYDFEKLKYVSSRLYSSTFVDTENSYKPTTFDDEQIVADMNFLNGAWYAYQMAKESK